MRACSSRFHLLAVRPATQIESTIWRTITQASIFSTYCSITDHSYDKTTLYIIPSGDDLPHIARFISSSYTLSKSSVGCSDGLKLKWTSSPGWLVQIRCLNPCIFITAARTALELDTFESVFIVMIFTTTSTSTLLFIGSVMRTSSRALFTVANVCTVADATQPAHFWYERPLLPLTYGSSVIDYNSRAIDWCSANIKILVRRERRCHYEEEETRTKSYFQIKVSKEVAGPRSTILLWLQEHIMRPFHEGLGFSEHLTRNASLRRPPSSGLIAHIDNILSMINTGRFWPAWREPGVSRNISAILACAQSKLHRRRASTVLVIL